MGVGGTKSQAVGGPSPHQPTTWGRCLLWPSVDNTSTNDDSDNRHHLKQPPLCQARLSPAHDCVGLIFQAKWVVAG